MERKVIALTFDDGPNLTTTNDVIDKLIKHDIIASFFLVGNNINEETEKVAKRAFTLGCELCNHSRTHGVMPEMTAEEMLAEINFTSEKIERITGKKPVFFRPPYIAVNELMTKTIPLTFISGFGAEDWNDEIPTEERIRRILETARNGSVILLHDMEGNFRTVEALDTIIPELKKQGYEFVTVSELFKARDVEPSLHNGFVYSYAEQTEPMV